VGGAANFLTATNVLSNKPRLEGRSLKEQVDYHQVANRSL